MSKKGTFKEKYSSDALDINDYGQITGYAEYDTGLQYNYRVFIYDEGEMKDTGINGWGKAINNHGEVVGEYAISDIVKKGFHLKNGQMTILNSIPKAINQFSQFINAVADENGELIAGLWSMDNFIEFGSTEGEWYSVGPITDDGVIYGSMEKLPLYGLDNAKYMNEYGETRSISYAWQNGTWRPLKYSGKYTMWGMVKDANNRGQIIMDRMDRLWQKDTLFKLMDLLNPDVDYGFDFINELYAINDHGQIVFGANGGIYIATLPEWVFNFVPPEPESKIFDQKFVKPPMTEEEMAEYLKEKELSRLKQEEEIKKQQQEETERILREKQEAKQAQQQ